ncbi:hypothetical protein PEPS_30300 (plasmid) [Persicobacter psychrovividus]|uniref:Phage protein n=2 Tax=Persicobacter psychrovividus TaxID=387638 RepID=A0ABM7VIG8_9BACT|nr:hypothetical protein PEPS_30300 [Persicobacter psychrovividus]
MRLKQSLTSLTFRKEAFEVVYQYYYCEDSQEEFTDEALDTLNLERVYQQYQLKYHR